MKRKGRWLVAKDERSVPIVHCSPRPVSRSGGRILTRPGSTVTMAFCERSCPDPADKALTASIRVGTRLAHYEIVGHLGSGGMGEVYRARDTKLNRDVALKILPDSFAHDPDRVARSKREAQVLASCSKRNG